MKEMLEEIKIPKIGEELYCVFWDDTKRNMDSADIAFGSNYSGKYTFEKCFIVKVVGNGSMVRMQRCIFDMKTSFSFSLVFSLVYKSLLKNQRKSRLCYFLRQKENKRKSSIGSIKTIKT